MQAKPFRLLPGQDLKKSCSSFLGTHKAAAVISAVGSLSVAHLRLAGAKRTVELPGPFEIVSLSGTLSPDGAHLHISLADSQGKVVGGHLMEGCLIHTTAEIIVLFMPDFSFTREMDSTTGYKELKIR